MIKPTPTEPQPQDDDASKQDSDGQDCSNHCTVAALPQSIDGYGCIVFERADYTLGEFLLKNRRKMDNIARQAVVHQILKGINWLHCRGLVHCDLKPHNLVYVVSDFTWKMIDMATASEDGEETAIHYTLRYAAPEVVQSAVSGKATMVCSVASDMWSFGVILYEMYAGKRFFDEALPDEDVVARLCSPTELSLKGRHNIDPNAARFISKLLVKDPAERWSSDKAISAQFFRSMDDTTKMGHAPAALRAEITSQFATIKSALDQVVNVQMTTLSDMQVGDLLVEIDLQEITPKRQPCLLTAHERAGNTFNLVNGRKYILVLSLFREGGNMKNPVQTIKESTLHTEDGKPLHLLPKPMPPQTSTPLPNCLTVGVLFDATRCLSASLLRATKFPEYRTIKMDISLELESAPGKTTSLMPSVHFQVHETETVSLKARHAKNWVQDKYTEQLSPCTRQTIKGVIVVAKIAAGVVMM
mmetsp:Transcript_40440/g.67758  ORF Transcript_40440/g.67758 Transcript_40440/m.67758 type:complete len:472 (+) Transcript_40440:553-1968(+)